ncbi:MAG: MFS transporter [Hyphomicrobiaceae bacterium]|nr:MFS transporter [Hyphomicrobiaceae bacterium]
MTPETLSRRTILFVNIAHAFDHFVLLIYPTAVIAIAAEARLDYASLITLATGAFVAFGLCSLPMGWLADRVGRRNMLAIFFIGYALSCAAVAASSSWLAIAASMLVLGVFSAIYHPIGTSMLVTHARELGRDLGWNGVWGNLGAALASGVTAFIAARWGWRAAFLLPGAVCLGVGLAFLRLVPGDGLGAARGKAASTARFETGRPFLVLALLAVAVVAGGMTFNITTIALPKVIDEGTGIALPLVLTGSLATAVFLCGAMMQLLIGRLIDTVPLPTLFVGLSSLQPIGLGLAAVSTGLPLLAGLVLVMAAIYGQVVINDAMVARYVPEAYRTKAFSVRYFLGFTASGFAAPLIALLHGLGGFPLVLWVAALFGAAVVGCAAMFKLVTGAAAPSAPVPAE